MKKLSLDQLVRKADHVVWKVVEGKGIVLNLENGTYFETNAVGLAVLEHCDGKATLSDIAHSVSEKFSTGLKQVEIDVAKFISDLMRQNMIEVD